MQEGSVIREQRKGVIPWLPWPASVHDGAGQVMWPGRCVVVRPQARVNLRNDHLLVRRTQLVDLIRQQRGRIQAMSANFNLLAAVTRNQLVSINRPLQGGRIA